MSRTRQYCCLVGYSTVNNFNLCSYLCYFVYTFPFSASVRLNYWWWNWGVMGRLGLRVEVKTSIVTDTETETWRYRKPMRIDNYWTQAWHVQRRVKTANEQYRYLLTIRKTETIRKPAIGRYHINMCFPLHCLPFSGLVYVAFNKPRDTVPFNFSTVPIWTFLLYTEWPKNLKVCNGFCTKSNHGMLIDFSQFFQGQTQP